MVESEYKCMVDGIQYQDMVNKLDTKSKGNRVVQVNYYYDAPDFQLDKKDITVRIRQKDEILSLEIKYPLERDGLLCVKNEVVCPIDKIPKRINVSKSELFAYLEGAQDIALIGVLITERISYLVKKGLKADVDKSIYFGAIDYELEIEFEEHMRQEALELLKELTGSRHIPPQGGKRERFMNRLRQMQEYDF